MLVETRQDRKRGCGWRKPGGLYLVSDGLATPCGRLPIPLQVCPSCHHGIKPSRGWTWINGDVFAAGSRCLNEPHCGSCPLARHLGMVGLLWIGEKFYATPADWTREVATAGVSRRISALPKNFALGETWVFVAHRKAIRVGAEEFVPGVFHAFKPTAVEYVVKGNESEEKLQAMRERGITPVRVERVEEQPALADMVVTERVQ